MTIPNYTPPPYDDIYFQAIEKMNSEEVGLSYFRLAKPKDWLIRLFRKLFIEHTPLQGYVAHIPHGLFVVLSAVQIHWVVAATFTIGFICFEVNQDWHLRDQAHNDLAGFLLGIVIGTLTLLLWRLL